MGCTMSSSNAASSPQRDAMRATAVRAVDSHAHAFDPVRFPLRDTGGHMPAPHECGTPSQFLAVLDAHGFTHGLLVNPLAGSRAGRA